MSVTQATLLGDTFGSAASGTIPVGGIIMWSGTIASIPTGWSLCNGANGTPNLIDRFVVGANTSTGDTTYPGLSVGATGGSADAVVVDHSHDVNLTTNQRGGLVRWEPSTPDPNVQTISGEAILTDLGNVGDKEETDAGNNGHRLQLDTRHTHTVIGATDSEGVSKVNANLPPYYALAFIMRVS